MVWLFCDFFFPNQNYLWNLTWIQQIVLDSRIFIFWLKIPNLLKKIHPALVGSLLLNSVQSIWCSKLPQCGPYDCSAWSSLWPHLSWSELPLSDPFWVSLPLLLGACPFHSTRRSGVVKCGSETSRCGSRKEFKEMKWRWNKMFSGCFLGCRAEPLLALQIKAPDNGLSQDLFTKAVCKVSLISRWLQRTRSWLVLHHCK